MQIEEVPRIQVFGVIVAVLARLAHELDRAHPNDRRARGEAQNAAMLELGEVVREDEALFLVRLVSEARIRCRMCNEVYPRSRCDGALCRDHASQLLASTEPQ